MTHNKDTLIDSIMDAVSILNEYLPSGDYEPIGEALATAIDTIRNAKPVVHSKLKHFRAYHQCDNCGQHFQTRMGQGNPLKWKGCPYCLAVWDADMRGDKHD